MPKKPGGRRSRAARRSSPACSRAGAVAGGALLGARPGLRFRRGGLRRLARGAGRDPGQQARQLVLAHGLEAQAQLPGHGPQGRAQLPQQAGLLQHARVLDGGAAAAARRAGAGGGILVRHAADGAVDRAGADAVRGGQLAVRGVAPAGEPGEAAVARRGVVAGVPVDGVDVQVVDDPVVLGRHAEAFADRDGVAGAQVEGGGQAAGKGLRVRAFHIRSLAQCRENSNTLP